MGQTLSGYDAMLKEFYLPAAQDSLPDLIELYDEFEKDTVSWVGNKAIEPVRVVRNLGVGSRADAGVLPTAGAQTYHEHEITAKTAYARVQVTGMTIRASANNEGAFSKAVTAEMKYAMKDLTEDIDRQIGASDGYGILSTVETAGTVTTLELDWAGATSGAISGEPGTRWLQAGMVVNIGTDVEHAAGTADSATISSITDGDTVVIGNTTVADGDHVVCGSSAALLNSAYLHEIEGIPAAAITTGEYQGINVGTYPAYAMTVDSNSGTNRTLDWDIIQKNIDAVRRKGGKVDLLVADLSMRVEYLNLVVSDKRYVGLNLDPGYDAKKGLKFNNEIDCKFVRNFNYNHIALLERGSWKLYVQGNLNWMNEDGAILSRVAGYDAYEAVLYYTANLGCSLPCHNAYIKDITVSL